MFVNSVKRLGRCGMGLLLMAASVGAASGDLRLVDAVKNRDKEAVGALLKRHIDVNTRQPDGATALHWAAHWDDLETATLLIGAGANVNLANDFGMTPLFLACTNGHAAMVETLLKAGANANAALPTETALMTCARAGSVEAVKALLARGAEVNAHENAQQQTGLMWAAAENHAEVARVLIEHGADLRARTTKAGFTPLLFAARNGAQDAVRLLLAKGASVNETASDGTSVLLAAIHTGHWELAHFLLEQGADPNADSAGYTALHWAAGSWETDISGVLGSDQYQWMAALGPGKMELVRALLARGANANARLKKTPPGFGYGGDYGGVDLRGATPFLLAAKGTHVNIMRALLAAGADPQLTTDGKMTPLMVAAGLGQEPGVSRVTDSGALEAVKLALELGNDINAANDAGETALHGAAYFDATSVAQFLVERGANVNAANKLGMRPLTIARGDASLVMNLLIHEKTAAVLRKAGGREEVELEAAITLVEESCPLPVLMIDPFGKGPKVVGQGRAIRTIKTTAATQYANGGCADLKEGTTVRVTGTRPIGNLGAVDASQIQIKN